MVLNTPRIMFVGAVIVDELCKIDGPLPMRAGKVVLGDDVVFNNGIRVKADQVEKQFRPTDRALPQVLGGSAGNCGMSAGFLSERKGIQTPITVLSKFGEGPQSQKAARLMSRRNIGLLNASNPRDFDIPKNFVISSDERCIIVNKQEYPAIQAGFEDRLREFIRDNVDMLHVHTRIDDLAVMAARIGAEEGKTIYIDASEHSPTLDAVMPYGTHAYLPDELTVPGMNHKDPRNPMKVLHYITSFENIEHAIVTCGGDPTLYRAKDEGVLYQIPVQTTDAYALSDKLAAGDVTRASIVLDSARQFMNYGDVDMEAAIAAGMRDGTFSAGFDGREWEAQYSQPNYQRLIGQRYEEQGDFGYGMDNRLAGEL